MNGKKEPKKYFKGCVEEGTYKKFQRIALKRHGFKRGRTGKALQEALELYIGKFEG